MTANQRRLSKDLNEAYEMATLLHSDGGHVTPNKEQKEQKEEKYNTNNRARTVTVAAADMEEAGTLKDIKLTKILGGNEWYSKNEREVVLVAELTLLDVDLQKQLFESEILFLIYWQQPELKPKNSDISYIPEDVAWEIYDDGRSIPVDLDDLFEGDLSFEWIEKEYEYDDDTQTVCMLLRLRVTCGERMELQRFPIDRQFLNILLKSRIANKYGKNEGNWIWRSNIKDIEWLPEEVRKQPQLQTRLGPALSEYDMECAWADFRVLNGPHEKDPQPPFKIRFRVERRPGFYVGQIIIPMLLITVCCFASLTMDEVADRLSVSITMLLAIVAYRYVLSAVLPPIQYLTWMDYYILCNFLIVGIFVLENCLPGIGIDGADEVENLDLYFMIAAAGLIAIINGFMLFIMYRKDFRITWEKMDLLDRNNDNDDLVPTDDAHILSQDNNPEPNKTIEE